MRSFLRKLFRKKNKTQKNKRTVFETVAPFLNKRAAMAAPLTRKSPPYNRLQKNKSGSTRKSSDFSMSSSKSGKRSGSYNKLYRPHEGTDTQIQRIASYKRQGLRVKTGGLGRIARLFTKKSNKVTKCEKINNEYRRKLAKHGCVVENTVSSALARKLARGTVKEGDYEVPLQRTRTENDYATIEEPIYASIKSLPPLPPGYVRVGKELRQETSL